MPIFTSARIAPERYAVAHTETAHPNALATITNLDSVTVIITEIDAVGLADTTTGWRICRLPLDTTIWEKRKEITATIPCLWLIINELPHILLKEEQLPRLCHLFITWGWQIE